MIWKELAEKNMAESNVSSYEIGAQYLRKAMKIMMQIGKGCEWETYLRDLKTVHRRRP